MGQKIFLVFIISLILLLAIGILSFQVAEYIKTVTLEKFNDQQLVLARQAREGIGSFIDNICKNLEYYAESPELESRDRLRLKPVLDRVYTRELLNIINLIISYDTDEQTIYFPELIESPALMMPVLRKTMTGVTAVTDYFLVLDGLPSIVINTPLRKRNFPDRIYGHMNATISLSRIERLFIEPSIPTESSKIYLLDKTGRTLISNDETTIGADFFSKFPVNDPERGACLDNTERKFTAIIRGVPYVIAHTPVKVWTSEWHLLILTPQPEALANLQPWLQKMTRSVLVITLLIIFLYSLLSLFVISAHKRETAAAEKIRSAEARELLQQEIKRREEFLTDILASTQDMVFTIDRECRFTFANRRLLDTLGIHEGLLRNKSLFDYIPPADQEPLRHYISGATSESQPISRDCGLLTRGQTRSVIISVAPVMSFENQPHFVCVITDITELKQLQERLIQADKMVTLGTMAGGIAHEINNPLCSVLGFAKMGSKKAEELKDQQLLKFFDSIHRAAEHSKKIIDNLLRYASQGSFTFHPVALRPILADALLLLEKQFESAAITVRQSGPEERLVVFGDENQLQQVFTNLAVNAINAMAPGSNGMAGGGEFCVTIEPAGDQVAIRFRDTGCGIPPENLDKIFDPFFTTKPVWSGTGLGLAISQTIIKEHRGRIEVASKPGNTVFSVYLPLPEYTEPMSQQVSMVFDEP